MSRTAPRSRSIRSADPPALDLPRPLATALLSAAASAGAFEICGFVAAAAGAFSRYAVANCAAQPATYFAMDPAGQIAAFKAMRQSGESLLAIYHSHPRGEAVPSAADSDDHNYPETPALLLAPQAKGEPIRAWQLVGTSMREIAITWNNARWQE
jgi:proteasome lid subunit RPN8/RPN11